MTNVFSRLQHMDDRILYLLVGLAVLLPLFKPLGLPLIPSKMSQDVFDAVDRLPSGSTVFFASECGPTNQAEVLPQVTVLYRHALEKGLKVVYCPIGAAAEPYMAELMERFPAEYGTDVVILPFKAGDESLVVQIGQNFRGVYNNDLYGKPLKDMPIMQDLNSISDVDLVISFGTSDIFRWVIRHIQAAQNVPTVIACGAVITTLVTPFYSSGQLVGILSGLGGAADYEFLASLPGKALAGMDAQSLGHAVLILVILLGNVGLFISRKKPLGDGGGI